MRRLLPSPTSVAPPSSPKPRLRSAKCLTVSPPSSTRSAPRSLLDQWNQQYHKVQAILILTPDTGRLILEAFDELLERIA